MVKKIISMVFIYIIIAMIVLPALITYCSYHGQNKQQTQPQQQNEEQNAEIATPEIIRTSSDFENYIKGVVAAEMPALFQTEALKAQAVSARTYATRKMYESNTNTIPYDIGQAYITVEEMKQKWGEHFTEYYNKISDAVEQTKGEIMIYDNEPILAVFHSESAGKTEDAENVWQKQIPYLKSVDSSLDKNAPDFEKSISYTFDEMTKSFCNTYKDFSFSNNQIKILSHTPAGYVQKIQIGNKTLTGREVREILNLRSSNFTVNIENNTVIFTTKGYGHGAGMSQYGAEFMAKEGKTYREILQHYYTGISFSHYTNTVSFP